jgi:CheY-like chemotaxis protein
VPARTLLLVEDNPANREMFTFLLEEAGYAVRHAGDATSAMRELELALPDAVLLDMNLPGTDGLAFVSGLRRDPRFDALPVIALTAHAMRGDRERFLAGGCDGYLPKPIDTRSFVDAVAAHVTRGRSDP